MGITSGEEILFEAGLTADILRRRATFFIGGDLEVLKPLSPHNTKQPLFLVAGIEGSLCDH